MAKQNQISSVRVMAKDLIRIRHSITKFHGLKSQLQGVSLKMQTLKSTQAMAEAMRCASVQGGDASFLCACVDCASEGWIIPLSARRGVAKAMAGMNRQLNLPTLQATLREFEKQSERMDMTSEARTRPARTRSRRPRAAFGARPKQTHARSSAPRHLSPLAPDDGRRCGRCARGRRGPGAPSAAPCVRAAGLAGGAHARLRAITHGCVVALGATPLSFFQEESEELVNQVRLHFPPEPALRPACPFAPAQGADAFARRDRCSTRSAATSRRSS